MCGTKVNGGTQHVDYSDGWTSITDGRDQGGQSGVVLGKASLAQVKSSQIS